NRVVVPVVGIQLKEYSARRAGCGSGAQAVHLRFRQNSEGIRTCGNVAARVPVDAGLIDRGHAVERTLGNLVDVFPAAVEDAGVTGYLEVYRRVEEAAAAAENSLTVAGQLPGKSKSR